MKNKKYIIICFYFLSVIPQNKNEDSLSQKQMILCLQKFSPELLTIQTDSNQELKTSLAISFIERTNKRPISFFNGNTPLEYILKNQECRKIILQALELIKTNKLEKDNFKEVSLFTIKKLEAEFSDTPEYEGFQTLIKDTFTTPELLSMQSQFSQLGFLFALVSAPYLIILPSQKGGGLLANNTSFWKLLTFQEKLFPFIK